MFQKSLLLFCMGFYITQTFADIPISGHTYFIRNAYDNAFLKVLGVGSGQCQLPQPVVTVHEYQSEDLDLVKWQYRLFLIDRYPVLLGGSTNQVTMESPYALCYPTYQEYSLIGADKDTYLIRHVDKNQCLTSMGVEGEQISWMDCSPEFRLQQWKFEEINFN